MISLYDIEDTRTLIEPYFLGTSQNGWRDSREAVYDLPRIERKELVRRFEIGEETPGYIVKKTVLGVGTTVSREYRWVDRLGGDDGDSVLFATYRDAEGKWLEVAIWNDYNTATVDAPPDVFEARNLFLVEEANRRETARVAEDLRRRRAERVEKLAEPSKGKFLRVSRGRKVSPGLVGVAFWEGIRGENGPYPAHCCGIATSSKKGADGRYIRREYVDTRNLDVLLQETPSDPRQLSMLYLLSSSLFVHVLVGCESKCAGFAMLADCTAETELSHSVEVFPRFWSRLSETPWKLAAFDALSPFDLPRVSASDIRTIDEIFDAVESMTEVREELDRLVEARLEAYEASGEENAEAWRTKARLLIEQALPTSYKPKKRAKSKKSSVATQSSE